MPKPDAGFQAPTWKGWSGPTLNFSGERSGLRGSPLLAIGGLIALIFVGAPLYQYSIPLWAALYPLAAVGTLLVYAGVMMGLKEFIFAAVATFVAAWPLTLVEHGVSNRNRGYWMLRHVVRLVLLFVWAIYALTLRQLNLQHVPDITRGGWPQMHVTAPRESFSRLASRRIMIVTYHTTEPRCERTWRSGIESYERASGLSSWRSDGGASREARWGARPESSVS